MTTLIFAMAMVLLLVGYYLSKRKTTARVFVQCVEAGPTSISNADELKRKSYYDKDSIMRGIDGEVLSSAHYKRILVSGSCMDKKNIHDGDVLIAEYFNENKDFHKELKSGDVVWLHIEDSGIDKIRVFDSWNGEEMMTYYYENGERHPSSSNHSVSQIRGIVRYRTNS